MYSLWTANEKTPKDMSMVSGHNKMYSLRDGRVLNGSLCLSQIAKPYSSNERFCYTTAHQLGSPLARYIARYYGSCSLEV